jgi:methylglutaconyl-CoA hydratase
VIVLTHAGRVFCSGADLKATAAATGAGDMPIASVPTLLAALAESPKPVVARVGGPARAGGIGLIAACDVALAGRSATFAFTEVRLGVVPAVIRCRCRWCWRCGRAGSVPHRRVFDATRAAEIGLVTRVVDDADLDAEVARHVDRSRSAPLVRRGHEGSPRPPVDGLRGPVRPLRRTLRQLRGPRRRRRVRGEAAPRLGSARTLTAQVCPAASASRIVSGRPLTVERCAPSRSTSSAVRYTAG